MRIHIFFSIVFITTASLSGMKRNIDDTTQVLCNTDLIPIITERICINHTYNPKNIRSDIHALAYSCTFLHHYFSQEKVRQNIIRQCSLYNDSNDKDTAHSLELHRIHKKIDYYTNIALDKKKNFTDDDLKDEWYLSMHTSFFSLFLQKYLQQPLIQVALNHSPGEKVLLMLQHIKDPDFYHNKKNNILQNIAENRYRTFHYEMAVDYEKLEQLLKIARHLLDNKMFPDERKSDSFYTPLMYTIKHKDWAYIRLLLTYDADPDALYKEYLTSKKKTAFDLSTDKKQLQEIIDEVKEKKNKQKES